MRLGRLDLKVAKNYVLLAVLVGIIAYAVNYIGYENVVKRFQ